MSAAPTTRRSRWSSTVTTSGPICGEAKPVVRELLSSFGDDLCYVWRHLPLTDVHRHAQPATEAAEAAGAPGRVLEKLLADPDELPIPSGPPEAMTCIRRKVVPRTANTETVSLIGLARPGN
jgi:hypothetical protein